MYLKMNKQRKQQLGNILHKLIVEWMNGQVGEKNA